TEYLWFNTKKHREFINITDELEKALGKAQVKEGFVAGVGDAHHGGRLHQRCRGRADRRYRGMAREAGALSRGLPSSQDGRDQRRCTSQKPADRTPGPGACHEWEAGLGTMATGVLRRIRRSAAQARNHQG